MWLIATFPSKAYDINDYPAVRDYLLSFGIERLEQSGKTYVINGEKVRSRKKTNNKWFETQDSISYWDDFSKQKLVWTAVNSEYRFTILPKDYFMNNSLFMIVDSNLPHLCGIFNSSLYKFYLNLLLAKDSYAYGSKEFFMKIPVILPKDKRLSSLVDSILEVKVERNYIYLEEMINNEVMSLYGLTDEEKAYVKKSASNSR